jgi:hypothetical protein
MRLLFVLLLLSMAGISEAQQTASTGITITLTDIYSIRISPASQINQSSKASMTTPVIQTSGTGQLNINKYSTVVSPKKQAPATSMKQNGKGLPASEKIGGPTSAIVVYEWSAK